VAWILTAAASRLAGRLARRQDRRATAAVATPCFFCSNSTSADTPPRPSVAGVSAADFPAGTGRRKLHLFSLGVGGGNASTGVASSCGGLLSFFPDRKLFSHLPAFPIDPGPLSISAAYTLNAMISSHVCIKKTLCTTSHLMKP
jgi:hypothetical protein